MTEPTKPTIYLSHGPDNSVSISAYPFDHPDYESHHWDLLDNHAPYKLPQDTLMSCLSNVLFRAGVKVVME